MTIEQYNEISEAADVLCNFCENDECEKCQVTLLVEQAYTETDNSEISNQ